MLYVSNCSGLLLMSWLYCGLLRFMCVYDCCCCLVVGERCMVLVVLFGCGCLCCSDVCCVLCVCACVLLLLCVCQYPSYVMCCDVLLLPIVL